MTVGVLVFVLVNLSGAVQEPPAKSAETVRERGAFQTLVDLVGSGSPDAIKQAEAAHATLLQSGSAPVAASYALALIYVRENKLDLAVKLLDTLPNEAKLSPPVLRLRLYLAMERDERALAARLVPLLREHAQSNDKPQPERVSTAKLLGGIMGALPGDSTSALPTEIANDTITQLSAAEEPNVKNAFRLAQSEAAKRRGKLQAILAAAGDKLAGDKAAGEASLKQTLAEKEQAAKALQACQDDLAAKIREDKGATSETTGKLRQLGQEVRNLERDWKLETPGKPHQPVRPMEPRQSRPTRPNNNDQQANERYEREMFEYRKAQDSYRNALQAFEVESRTYPQRLSAWQQQDKTRRDQLQAARQNADAAIATIRAAKDEREKKVEDLRQDIKRQSVELQELEAKVRVLESVAAGETLKEGWLSRPSNYDLLSFAAERQRLMQVKP